MSTLTTNAAGSTVGQSIFAMETVPPAVPTVELVDLAVKPPRHRGRYPDLVAQAYNRALFEVVEGRKGTYRNLATIAHMTEAEIVERVERARWSVKPVEPGPPTLDGPERRYIHNYYLKPKFAREYDHRDKAIRDWLALMNFSTADGGDKPGVRDDLDS